MIFYKYRDFLSTFWNSSFRECGFWFSTADQLDDKDEVKVEGQGGVEFDQFYQEIRSGTSILSLGQCKQNVALWEKYGGKGTGFCIEADLSGYTRGPELQWEYVRYIPGRAALRVDFDLINRFKVAPQTTLAHVWERLFLQKSATQWGTQCEVRFLHLEQPPQIGYTGRLEVLPATAFKAVYVKPNQISVRDRGHLEREIQNFNAHHGSNLEVVNL